MITNWQDTDLKTFKYELVGLSTDVKPTSTYDGKAIANGSTFFEMDTQNVKFYDEANNVWV